MIHAHFLNNFPKLRHFLPCKHITSTMCPIKTFVFLDLETTGLPHLEHNKTRITELCAVAVQADHIELGCFPRVHNKLSFCFNPQKLISPESSDITGLSNELLERQGCFSSSVVDILNKWLEMNQKPICLVAHNGHRFDYPILKAEIEKTGNNLLEDVVCVDSLQAFRHIDDSQEAEEPPKGAQVPFEFNDDFDEILSQACDEYERENGQGLSPTQVQKINETTPKKQMISAQSRVGRPNGVSKRSFGTSSCRQWVGYKLSDVYKRLTSKEPLNAHEAEGDVVMMITCAAVYGEKFVVYSNQNCIKFDDVPAMKPGKRIGL